MGYIAFKNEEEKRDYVSKRLSEMIDDNIKTCKTATGNIRFFCFQQAMELYLKKCIHESNLFCTEYNGNIQTYPFGHHLQSLKEIAEAKGIVFSNDFLFSDYALRIISNWESSSRYDIFFNSQKHEKLLEQCLEEFDKFQYQSQTVSQQSVDFDTDDLGR